MTSRPSTPSGGGNPAADVTSPGEPLTTGRDAPSSGPFGGDTADAEVTGTAAGNPLAGVGAPEQPTVRPDGSEESLDDA